MVTAGQFRESAKAERVFFIEELDVDNREVKNIFVADSRNQRLSIVVAATGFIENTPSGDKNVILKDGRRYEGLPTQPDFRILEFDEYETKLRSKELTEPQPRDRERSVQELLKDSTPSKRGELLWRIGLPLMALGLVFIAIPLAYVNPRLGNYTAMFYAVLVYLIYSNLLNLAQNFVSQKRLDFFVAIWPIHLVALLIAAVLIRNRINPSIKWWKRQLPAFLTRP
jgi:lipopolysaccharide export system permease protein